jgi:hypothetical protein
MSDGFARRLRERLPQDRNPLVQAALKDFDTSAPFFTLCFFRVQALVECTSGKLLRNRFRPNREEFVASTEIPSGRVTIVSCVRQTGSPLQDVKARQFNLDIKGNQRLLMGASRPRLPLGSRFDLRFMMIAAQPAGTAARRVNP